MRRPVAVTTRYQPARPAVIVMPAYFACEASPKTRSPTQENIRSPQPKGASPGYPNCPQGKRAKRNRLPVITNWPTQRSSDPFDASQCWTIFLNW